jgi:chitodextrinase
VSAASKLRALAAASVFAVVVLAIVGSAGGARKGDKVPPSVPTDVRVTNSTTSSVAVAWEPSTDNVAVFAYEVFGEVRRTRTKLTKTTADRLACGDSFAIWVTALDRAGNRSAPAIATVATAPCPDTTAPSTPSGFRQSATTQDAVVLSWDPATDNTGVAGYGVYKSGVPLASTSEPAVTLSQLACGSTYELAVDAFDAAGNRSPRATAWVVTANCTEPPPPPPGDTTPPSQPSSVAVDSATQTSVALTWAASTDDVGVAGYGVYRNSTLTTSVAQPGATVSGLTCGTAYTFQVDAYDTAGNRSGKASVTGVTAACADTQPPPPGDTTPPSQPSSVAVDSATQTSVALTWAASTDDVGVAGYGVYRNSTLTTSVAQPGATVSGLTCGTAYTFQVDAYDTAGNRSGKASVTGVTAACADTQPPTTPTNVVATSRTATSIALSWTASTDNVGVAGYGLHRGSSLVGTSATNSGIFSNLTCNTTYTLAVDAYDAAGNRSGKTTVTVATTACADTSAPSAPTALAASNVSQTGLSLTWAASTDNVGVAGYDVYLQNAKVGSTSGTSHAFTGLTCGTSYTLGVVAYDAAGNRSSQSTLTGLTSACSPPPPSSSVNWPSSYFTGPLGAKNPVPPKQGAFLLAWHGGQGCDWQCIKSGILGRQQAMGRKFDGIANAWRPFESERVEQWVHDQGALPIIAGWTPGGTPQEIASGARDAKIKELADYLKVYDFTVMLRMFHEFDMPHLSYHACGDTFKAMWQRVVDVFKREGATNVGFWWSPNEGYDRACVAASYPGDAYVDWVGSDAYNWQYVGEGGWVTPLHPGWAEFWELFDYQGLSFQNQHDIYGPRKPFVVGETGTVYDSSFPSKKGDWFRDIPRAAKEMEHLTGIMFFDQDVSAVEGPKANWWVHQPSSNASVYSGFVEMARDPYFNTR